MLENIQQTLEPISKFFYIVTNPKIIFIWLVDMSYWIAVIVSVTSTLFFIVTNSKKSKQILGGTVLGYILLRGVASVL